MGPNSLRGKSRLGKKYYFCGSQNRSQTNVQQICKHALKSEAKMISKSLKNVTKGALSTGMDAREKKYRKSYPLDSSQVSSRPYDSTGFVFHPSSQSSPKL